MTITVRRWSIEPGAHAGRQSRWLHGASAVAAVAAVLLSVAPARAADLDVGALCRLEERLVLRGKPGGKKMAVAAPGEKLEVLDVGKKWTQVKHGPDMGFAPTRKLEKACVQIDPDADEPDGELQAVAGRARPSAQPGGAGADAAPAAAQPAGAESSAQASAAAAGGATAAAAKPATPEGAAPAAAMAADAATKPASDAGDASAPPASPTESSESAFGDTFKIKIAVMTLSASESIPSDVAASLSNVVPETLDALGPFKAISSQDIQQMLAFESNKQMLGCDDESCLAEIGGALGADFMVSGSITRIGQTSVIQLQLTNIARARVDNRISREYTGELDGLFESLRTATKQLMREILGERSGSLHITVSEEGATISVDGSIVGVSPLPAPITIAAGSHTVAAEKTGFIVNRRDYNVTQDNQTGASLLLQPSAEFVKEYERKAGTVRTLAWVALGVGAAGLGAAATLYAVSDEQARQLDADIRAYNAASLRTTDEAQRLESERSSIAAYDLATTLSFSAGLVAAGTGVLLWILGDDPGRYDDQPKVSDGPSASFHIGPGGVQVLGRF